MEKFYTETGVVESRACLELSL